MSNTNYWNHYIYTQIIKNSFSDKLTMKKVGKITKNNERDLLYQKLKTTNMKEKLSLYIQKFFNFFFLKIKVHLYFQLTCQIFLK